MAEQLVDWLRDEVQLSRDVRSFESEFSNGYLLGEVLAKHNQQPDFLEGAFRDDDRSDTKVGNFTKIEPTLARMGIKFDSRRAHSIMSGQRDAAMTLLYEIRSAAVPLNKVAVSSRPPPVGGIKAARLSLRSRAEPHARAQSALFAKSIRAKADNQNDLFLKKHMRNFGRGVERLWAQRDAMGRAREDAHRAALNQQRLRQLHLLRTNRMLRAAREEHGVREWQRNMEVRLAQGMRGRRLERAGAARRAEAAEGSDAATADDVADGVEYFEEAARRLGVELEAGGKDYDGEDEAAELMEAVGGGSTLPPLDSTARLGREEYFEELERRLGSREAAEASAAAILARLQRRKAEADELMDKRRRRRAAFASAGAELRSVRLEADRRRGMAADLRARSRAEALVDGECAAVASLEGGMRLRKARADEDAAVATLRAEAAALRWDGELWAAASAAHGREAEALCGRLADLRAAREASRCAAVEALCGEEAGRLVEGALAAAAAREDAASLGPQGPGWEAVAEGRAGAAGEGGDAADAVPRAARAWEGQAGLSGGVWRRLVACVAAGSSPWLAVPPAVGPGGGDGGGDGTALASLPSAPGPGGAVAWRAREEDVAAAMAGDEGAAARLAVRSLALREAVRGEGGWAGLADGEEEASRLDRLLAELSGATPGEEDEEAAAGKGGKKKGGKKADAKAGKKGGKKDAKGGAAAGEDDDGSAPAPPVPAAVLRLLLGAAAGDAFASPGAAAGGDDDGDAAVAAASASAAADADAGAAPAAGPLDPSASAPGPLRAVVARCIEELRRAVEPAPAATPPAPGLPSGLHLTAAVLAPPYAPLAALAGRLASAFGLRCVDPWLLLVEARTMARAARADAQASPGGPLDASLTVTPVDDVGADGAAAGPRVPADGDDDALGSMLPEGGDEASLVPALRGADRLAALAAENCDPTCDGPLRRLLLGAGRGGFDGDDDVDGEARGGCSLGDAFADDMRGLGEDVGAEEADADRSGEEWWSPSPAVLVRAVVLGLRALASDIAAAAAADAEAADAEADRGLEAAADGAETAAAGAASAAEAAGVRGWLLVGFPRTPEQAAALELLLTGWAPRTREPSEWRSHDPERAAAERADAAAPLPAAARVPRPEDATAQRGPRGLSAVLRLDTDSLRAARYALGWRSDPVADVMPEAEPGADVPAAASTALARPSKGAADDTTALLPPRAGSARAENAAAAAAPMAPTGVPPIGGMAAADDAAPARPASRGAAASARHAVLPVSARNAPSALPLDASARPVTATGPAHPAAGAGPAPWVWTARTEEAVGARAAAGTGAASARSRPVPDHVRASALDSGYVPTLRSGPPLYHVDVLPPAFALDHKGELRRAAVSAAASARGHLALMAREAAGASARLDAWYQRTGVLRLLRWHKPAVEAAAVDELGRPSDAPPRPRVVRAIADVRSLEAERRSAEAAAATDEVAAPAPGGWAATTGRGGAPVPGSDSWPEYVAPARCAWAVVRRDVLSDDDLFAVAARALAHAFRESGLRRERLRRAAEAEAGRRADAVAALREAFMAALGAAEDLGRPTEAAEPEAEPGAEPGAGGAGTAGGKQESKEVEAGEEEEEASHAGAEAKEAEEEEEAGGAEAFGPDDGAAGGANGEEAGPLASVSEIDDGPPRPVIDASVQPPPLPAWLAVTPGAQAAADGATPGSLGDAAPEPEGAAADVGEEAEQEAGDAAAEAEAEPEAEAEGKEEDGDAAAAEPAPPADAPAEPAEAPAVPTEAELMLELVRVPLRDRAPLLVEPGPLPADAVAASGVALARAASAGVLRRWRAAAADYGDQVERHTWRAEREVEAALQRSAAAVRSFVAALAEPSAAYDDALRAASRRLASVPAASRGRAATRRALEADVDAVAAGLRAEAGRRFDAASALAATVAVPGWREAALWSVVASAVAMLRAERHRLAHGRAAVLEFSAIAAGAVVPGSAPAEAEAALLREVFAASGVEAAAVAAALEAGDGEEDEEAAAGGKGGKKKDAKGGKKADAKAGKKGGKKDAKGGAADDDDAPPAPEPSGLDPEQAAALAWRLGLLDGPLALPAPLAAVARVVAAPGGDAAPPPAAELIAEAAAACGGDEAALEADVAARSSARIRSVMALLLSGADVGELAAPYGVPAPAAMAPPVMPAALLGAPAAEDDTTAASDADADAPARVTPFAALDAAVADCEGLAAAVVWDGGRRRRFRVAALHGMGAAERRRRAAEASLVSVVAQEREEARAEAEAEAAAAAAAASGDGKKKKGASGKDKKKDKKGAEPDLPATDDVFAPLTGVLVLPDLPAVAAAAMGRAAAAGAAAAVAGGSDPRAVARAVIDARCAAVARADARVTEQSLGALEAEARQAAARARVVRRAVARAAERIDAAAAQATRQAEATARARLEGELEAVEAARAALLAAVSSGGAPAYPLRVDVRAALPEEQLARRLGRSGTASDPRVAAVSRSVRVSLVEDRSGDAAAWGAPPAPAETAPPRESRGPEDLTPSGFTMLVSALRAVAEAGGNPAIGAVRAPEAGAGSDAPWGAVEDSVPVRSVAFGADGAPIDEAAEASGTDVAAAGHSDAGSVGGPVPAEEGGTAVAEEEGEDGAVTPPADAATPHAGAAAPAVPAGAWVPEGAVTLAVRRLAAAGKLGAAWQAAATSGGGEAVASWVARHRVRPEDWPAAPAGSGVSLDGAWVDWRRACTAALFAAPAVGSAGTAPASGDDEGTDADVVALARSGAVAPGRVPPGLPSADDVAAMAAALAAATGTDPEASAALAASAGTCDELSTDAGAAAGVDAWFGRSLVADDDVAAAAADHATARLDAAAELAGEEALARAVPVSLAASDPRSADGLGGWHQQPVPHPSAAAVRAAAEARARFFAVRGAVGAARSEHEAATTDAHLAGDAFGAALTRQLMRAWTDSAGTLRWGRMLYTVGAVSRQLAEGASPWPVAEGAASASVPAASAAAAPPADAASDADAEGAAAGEAAAGEAAADVPLLVGATATTRREVAAGTASAADLALAEAAACAAAAAVPEAPTKGKKGKKR